MNRSGSSVQACVRAGQVCGAKPLQPVDVLLYQVRVSSTVQPSIQFTFTPVFIPVLVFPHPYGHSLAESRSQNHLDLSLSSPSAPVSTSQFIIPELLVKLKPALNLIAMFLLACLGFWGPLVEEVSRSPDDSFFLIS